MKRLIKADLTAILRLAGECQPIEADRLDMSLSKLCRQEFSDYLFLARRGWCGLFDFPAIYEKDSYANLCWTAYLDFPGPRVDALYLHIYRTIHGHPFGVATVLDYAVSARDVEQFAARTRRETAAHVRRVVKHYRTHARIGSTLDFINHLQESR